MRLSRLMIVLGFVALACAGPASAARTHARHAGRPVAVLTTVKTKVKHASHAVHRQVVADAHAVKRASHEVRAKVAADAHRAKRAVAADARKVRRAVVTDAHKVKRAVATDAHKAKRAIVKDAHKVKRSAHELHRKVSEKISAWRESHRTHAA